MKISSIFTFFAAAVIFAGCSSFKQNETEVLKLREFSPEDNAAAAQAAGDFADGFVRSMKSGNFSFWQKYLPPENAARITPEKFAAMRNELQEAFGEFRQAQPLGMIITGNLQNYLWKLTFSRKSKNGESLYEIVYFVRIFCEEGKTPAVSGFGVKRF